jgi:hypothetical protein
MRATDTHDDPYPPAGPSCHVRHLGNGVVAPPSQSASAPRAPSTEEFGDPGVNGIAGDAAGAAVVPGLALIETLPVVSQIVVSSNSWQVGRACAAGAAMTIARTPPTIKSADVPSRFIGHSPFDRVAV